MFSNKCLKKLVTLAGRLQTITDSTAILQARSACLKGEFAALSSSIQPAIDFCMDHPSKLADVQPRAGAGKPTLHIECADTRLRARNFVNALQGYRTVKAAGRDGSDKPDSWAALLPDRRRQTNQLRTALLIAACCFRVRLAL
jgi:hypothetical protein